MLAELPAILMLVGLAAYAVLAGADFGAGFWMLFARRRRASLQATRDHARHAMGPVWEANHVWLIFVLVVCWTAYPTAFASILSTLSIPMFVAAVGIILRGASYALRAELDLAPGRRSIENVFALSSILTPFALGVVIGAIASGRVPVGNAQGDPIASWLQPTSLLVGALFVATSSDLAAVYLAADACRLDESHLEDDFRSRALRTGVVAGALALAGPFVLRADAPRIWDGLTRDGGLAMVALSTAAGLTTLALVARRRFGPARVSAALAVAAIVAGFGFAQQPELLPGLRIDQAAAGRPTLVAIAVGVAAGAIVLVPSLGLLFGLFLRGRLESVSDASTLPDVAPAASPDRPSRLGALPLTCFVVGAGLLLLADVTWARAVGAVSLLAFAWPAFVRLAVVADE
ncbi:MAG TPA: cytochrome d ubiquinol oxidase subunit II [Myxococcota bacterium]|nr:cytochrome d ubiquinol oxidase subunit II [Myxococcota bacterium]